MKHILYNFRTECNIIIRLTRLGLYVSDDDDARHSRRNGGGVGLCDGLRIRTRPGRPILLDQT